MRCRPFRECSILYLIQLRVLYPLFDTIEKKLDCKAVKQSLLLTTHFV